MSINEAEQIKLPPWEMFPEINAGSMGWRMGAGEAYYEKWVEMFLELPSEERNEYMSNFPEPRSWEGVYSDVLKTENEYLKNKQNKNKNEELLQKLYGDYLSEDRNHDWEVLKETITHDSKVSAKVLKIVSGGAWLASNFRFPFFIATHYLQNAKEGMEISEILSKGDCLEAYVLSIFDEFKIVYLKQKDLDLRDLLQR